MKGSMFSLSRRRANRVCMADDRDQAPSSSSMQVSALNSSQEIKILSNGRSLIGGGWYVSGKQWRVEDAPPAVAVGIS